MIRQHGPSAEDEATVFRWGLGQWAHDVLVRFSYELVEHDHRWPGQWLDDVFAAAARELRDVGHRLDTAVGRFEQAADRLGAPSWANVDDAVAAVAAAAGAYDHATGYLARALDASAAILPGAFGDDGRQLARRRRSIIDLGQDHEPLCRLDPALPAIVAEARTIREVVHTPVTAPEFEPAVAALRNGARLTGRVLAAAHESVPEVRAARAHLDRLATATYAVLDRALACSIEAVAARAEDGPELAERWHDRDWTVVRRTVVPR